ncbi:unnamed protein product [Callosobruchus maculatus]|uniref:SAGA-associated factor 11 n=1 Tax=Callosobruchus maculatus TaxID=64391 RepID=A0A653C1N9_CALMS|nr:unnamed protein product [Callosobruchus maculatus]
MLKRQETDHSNKEKALSHLAEELHELVSDEQALRSAVEHFYDQLVDELTLGIIFDIHRKFKTNAYDLDVENGAGAAGGNVDDEEDEEETPACVCPICESTVAASRFGLHLETCLGIGRTSTLRNASRRTVNNNSGNTDRDNSTFPSEVPSDDDGDPDWGSGDRRKKKKEKNGGKKGRGTPKKLLDLSPSSSEHAVDIESINNVADEDELTHLRDVLHLQLFPVTKPPKPKKQKTSKRVNESVSEESFHASLKLHGSLTYNKIQDGMVILGCVRHITTFSLEVELPGLTFGYVKVTNISDPFTKYLNKVLEENDEESDTILKKTFKVGQFLVVKVLKIEHSENKVHVECSINPRDINSDRRHTSFKKGMLVWACVQSQLDHGYEMNLGVKNCRAFLPNKNVDPEKTLSESTSVATTLRLSAKQQHIDANKIEEIDGINDLIPGMKVDVMIEKVNSKGLQCKFLEDYFGYIDETQLDSMKKTPIDYHEGKLVTGYVLYVEPTLKVTYLTMRNTESVPDPKYAVGEVLTIEVSTKAHNGVFLKLPNDEKGFVTNKRLVNSLPKKANIDISETIKAKYYPGSKHKCRILDYNRIARMYICTLEQALIKEKTFTVQDVKIGELLNVKIITVKPEGLVVSAGHVTGFVPNVYLSNAEYSDNMKKKYKEGQKVNARVLKITTDSNILFTLKPSQVESDKCLISLEQAKRGEQYPGVVVKTSSAGVLVVNVWIAGVLEDKVILSLNQPGELKKTIDLPIGRMVGGVVGKVYKDKIDVHSKNGKLLGSVHMNHLSCSLDLCHVFMKKYTVGEEIRDLLCIDNRSHPNMLSRREGLVFTRTAKIKMKNFKALKKSEIIRCSYVENTKSGIYVMPHILDYTENILIKNEDMMSEKSTVKFKLHQSILAKIINIDYKSKTLRLTAKLDKVFESNVNSTMELFSRYLIDKSVLVNYGKEHDWRVCQYNRGERVQCKVERLAKEGGCLVSLPNGAQGLVAAHLCPAGLKEGQMVQGVFLDVDLRDNYGEICLRNDINQKINKTQDGAITNLKLARAMVDIMLIKTDYVLALLRHKGNRQLVYIPLRLHENDFSGCKQIYQKKKFKICICGKTQNSLLGISKRLFINLEKRRKRITDSKIKHKNNEPKAPITEKMCGKKQRKQDVTSTDNNVESGSESASEDESVNGDTTFDGERSLADEANIAADETSSDDADTQDEDAEIVNETDDEMSEDADGDTDNSAKLEEHESNESELTEDEEVLMSNVDTAKKKKKLTAAERAELAKKEEERISKIERELADATKAPENAEQFDRLLMGNPNSSELWTKYMSFHIASTEIDKARTVAKRALQAINATLVDERLNIWLALLNLENMFGTKDSFEKTFEDAVKYNDSLTIYLKAIQMLAETGKIFDMEEKISKVRKKHKAEPKMWLEVAKTYYLINKFKEARNMKEAAVKSILDKKTQMEIIVRFAILEFKHGEEEHGAAIFETILSSEPRKVNIWTTYVDQLVKKGKIDQARRVLERSICQKLPLKSMKTLFLKFRTFEEQHGTEEAVEAVKIKAKEYVTRALDK